MLINSDNYYSPNQTGTASKIFVQKKYNPAAKLNSVGENTAYGAKLYTTDLYSSVSFGNKNQFLKSVFEPLFNLFNKISFNTKESKKFTLQEMLEYIETVKVRKGKISSFRDLNLNKIEDIAADIPIFAHLKAKDLKKITTNFDSILLQRGCPHQCSHCCIDAGKKITSMRWENFTEFADDTKKLASRLGFNPFKTRVFNDIFDRLPMENVVYPFADSDPMILRMKDSNGKIYSMFDAAKYYYEKTKTKFIITTAGWDKNNAISQKAAEEFAMDSTPGGLLRSFNISIHPFHKDMQKSIEYSKKGDKEKAEYWRNRYINNMYNVIKTTINMKNKYRYGVILEHLEVTTPENQELGPEFAEKLFREILKKLKKDGINISHFIKNNNLFNKENVEVRGIGAMGRASANYFSNKNARTFGTSMIVSPEGRILLKHGDPECLSDKPLENTKYHLNFRFPNEEKVEKPSIIEISAS